MSILRILKKDGTVYSVGECPADLAVEAENAEQVAQHTVKRIVFKRPGNLFNSGYSNSEPAYVIHIDDSPIVRVVQESAVSEFHFDTTKKEKNDGQVIIPELPEDDNG
jgi:hypothetical protein